MSPTATPTTREGYLGSTTALVKSVFRDVWTEFYVWEKKYCGDTLASLANNRPTNTRNANSSSAARKQRLDDIKAKLEACMQDDLELSDEDIEAPAVQPYPSYEACAPISSNIWRGDDSPLMPFIPYADDPDFNYAANWAKYDKFAWQEHPNTDDPDMELILMETASRLYHIHSIPIAQIDDTRVLPLPLIFDLMHKIRQRDTFDWPGATRKPLPPVVEAPEVNNFPGRLESYSGLFCSNINCLHACCFTHEEGVPTPFKIAPRVLSDGFFNGEAAPCGDNCFRLKNIPLDGSSAWSESDIENLQTFLDIIPDQSPCELSVLCRKPCREIFSQRRILIPDEAVILTSPKPIRKALKQHSKIADADPRYYTPTGPCAHNGPCTTHFGCACVRNKTHCERNCRCSLKCRRRWKGCRCLSSKSTSRKACRDDRCPCFANNRECDAELCEPCEARDWDKNICKNNALQQGRKKSCEVKTSPWGLGMYVTESVAEDELIIEYMGELILEDTVESREDLAIHRHRNYIFDLNATITIDGTQVGNESRFINHAGKATGKANAKAAVRLVNGDHRIGIYAMRKLRKGEEVLIDYGPSFFKDD